VCFRRNVQHVAKHCAALQRDFIVLLKKPECSRKMHYISKLEITTHRKVARILAQTTACNGLTWKHKHNMYCDINVWKAGHVDFCSQACMRMQKQERYTSQKTDSEQANREVSRQDMTRNCLSHGWTPCDVALHKNAKNALVCSGVGVGVGGADGKSASPKVLICCKSGRSPWNFGPNPWKFGHRCFDTFVLFVLSMRRYKICM